MARLIDPYALHRRQVDHQTVVANRFPRIIMPAASYRNRKLVFTSKSDAPDDIIRSRTSGDQSWPLIDHPIPNPPGSLVANVAWYHKLALKLSPKVLNGGFILDTLTAASIFCAPVVPAGLWSD